ncbi:Hypothetical predicted protein [Mytilus galloprovincialis]|uniref:Protein kinase domain-containing protein n=1 Tax=Mytilus galloprovincialis TaxID=29158 RepID=A0A8B6C4Y6_MYTGA|nr:Hypothetical predicted protein [Mytilus galloprovincialis]
MACDGDSEMLPIPPFDEQMNDLHMCNNLLIQYKNKNNIYENQYTKRPNLFAIEILKYPICDEARLYINRVDVTGEDAWNKLKPVLIDYFCNYMCFVDVTGEDAWYKACVTGKDAWYKLKPVLIDYFCNYMCFVDVTGEDACNKLKPVLIDYMLLEKMHGTKPVLIDCTTIADLVGDDDNATQVAQDSGIDVDTAKSRAEVVDIASRRKFSQHFHNFVDVCLEKDPTDRPTASSLLNHSFFKHLKKRSCDFLPTLVQPVQPLRADMLQSATPSPEDELVADLQNINVDDWEF